MSQADASDPAAALAAVYTRIAAAARVAGRDPASVALTAVTKTQPWAKVEPLLAAGQRRFGENRVQEAVERWRERRAETPDLELRLIGPLQSNKAAEATALFDVIETVDRERLGAALATAMQKLGRAPRLLVQVNTGEEAQKAGVAPGGLEPLLDRLREAHGLAVVGLMCIPPAAETPAPHFALLAQLARRYGLSELSMGMSGDYEVAVRFGATAVRVGSALFGARV